MRLFLFERIRPRHIQQSIGSRYQDPDFLNGIDPVDLEQDLPLLAAIYHIQVKSISSEPSMRQQSQEKPSTNKVPSINFTIRPLDLAWQDTKTDEAWDYTGSTTRAMLYRFHEHEMGIEDARARVKELRKGQRIHRSVQSLAAPTHIEYYPFYPCFIRITASALSCALFHCYRNHWMLFF